jgi:hypothetical protein
MARNNRTCPHDRPYFACITNEIGRLKKKCLLCVPVPVLVDFSFTIALL